MDVVNVSCVANIANVEHWQPKDLPKGQESQSEEENDLLNGIYWRQALDIRTGELSVGFNDEPFLKDMSI